MQISHLIHNRFGIQCKNCGAHFEVSSRALVSPDRLLEWKEGIAAKHTCRTAPLPMMPVVRVWHHPTGQQVAAYFTREVRRFLPA